MVHNDDGKGYASWGGTQKILCLVCKSEADITSTCVPKKSKVHTQNRVGYSIFFANTDTLRPIISTFFSQDWTPDLLAGSLK